MLGRRRSPRMRLLLSPANRREPRRRKLTMLKVITASNGMFTLESVDERPLSPEDERLCRLIDTNLRIGYLHVGAVSKLRRIAKEIEAGALAADDGLKQAETVHSGLVSAEMRFKTSQFTVKAIDSNGIVIDYISSNQTKGYDIKIHVEDVPISEEKWNFCNCSPWVGLLSASRPGFDGGGSSDPP